MVSRWDVGKLAFVWVPNSHLFFSKGSFITLPFKAPVFIIQSDLSYGTECVRVVSSFGIGTVPSWVLTVDPDFRVVTDRGSTRLCESGSQQG